MQQTQTWAQSLVWEDPLKECTTAQSSIPSWRFPMDRGVWQAIVHEVKKNQTRRKPLSTARGAHCAVAYVLSLIPPGPSNVRRSYTQICNKDSSFSSPNNPSVGIHLASLLILYNFLFFIWPIYAIAHMGWLCTLNTWCSFSRKWPLIQHNEDQIWVGYSK